MPQHADTPLACFMRFSEPFTTNFTRDLVMGPGLGAKLNVQQQPLDRLCNSPNELGTGVSLQDFIKPETPKWEGLIPKSSLPQTGNATAKPRNSTLGCESSALPPAVEQACAQVASFPGIRVHSQCRSAEDGCELRVLRLLHWTLCTR